MSRRKPGQLLDVFRRRRSSPEGGHDRAATPSAGSLPRSVPRSIDDGFELRLGRRECLVAVLLILGGVTAAFILGRQIGLARHARDAREAPAPNTSEAAIAPSRSEEQGEHAIGQPADGPFTLRLVQSTSRAEADSLRSLVLAATPIPASALLVRQDSQAWVLEIGGFQAPDSAHAREVQEYFARYRFEGRFPFHDCRFVPVPSPVRSPDPS